MSKKNINMENLNFTNKQIRKEALESLKKGYWSKVIGIVILYYIISGILNQSIGLMNILGVTGNIKLLESPNILISIFFILPLGYGLTLIYFKISREEELKIKTLFSGFSNKYFKIIGLILLILITIFLGLFLFIVPGIILSLMFSMSLFIMIDNPEMKIIDILKKSNEIMKGNKMKLLLLYLYFIMIMVIPAIVIGAIYYIVLGGFSFDFSDMFASLLTSSVRLLLALISILYIFWLYLYVYPYTWVSMAKFYNKIKANYIEDIKK